MCTLFYMWTALVICATGLVSIAFAATNREPDVPPRIVVVGDMHGDMSQALAILRAAEVISFQPEFYSRELGDDAMDWVKNKLGGSRGSLRLNRETVNRNMIYNKRGNLMKGTRADTYHWNAHDTTLIVLGDALNVGPDDLDIIYFLKRIGHEAKAENGKVVFLLGNHELQNLQGTYLGVHPWSFERSGGRTGRTELLSMREPVGRYLRSRQVLHHEKGLVFMHGGIVPATLKYFEKHLDDFGKPDEWIDEVNKRVRRALERWSSTPNGSPTGKVKDPIARLVLNTEYDKNGTDRSPVLVHPLDKCDQVKAANEKMGISTQVVGHTPHDPPAYRFCDGGLLAIDFHMSQWKGGQGTSYAALQLVRGPRRKNDTEMIWHTSLIVPSSHALEGDYTDEVTRIRKFYNMTNFIGGVILCVVALELVLCYCRRRSSRQPV
jgi:hypothetical protein